MSRPNILLIMSDEHDPAVTGCYGHPLAQTPNLDRLAAEGVLFENAYCNNPICVPSRMSFLTGRYASDVNVFDNGSPLASEIPTFAHYLEAAGYDTNLCGRMHMVGPDRLHGFGRRLFDDMNDWVRLGKGPIRTAEARRSSNSHVTECGPGPPSWLDYDRTATDLSQRFLHDRAANPTANVALESSRANELGYRPFSLREQLEELLPAGWRMHQVVEQETESESGAHPERKGANL